jgi:hypothetical protein
MLCKLYFKNLGKEGREGRKGGRERGREGKKWGGEKWGRKGGTEKHIVDRKILSIDPFRQTSWTEVRRHELPVAAFFLHVVNFEWWGKFGSYLNSFDT